MGRAGRFSRYEFFLQRMDRNDDGKIEPDELDGRAGPMFERMARRAGLDPTNTISVEDFRKAMENRSRDRGGGGREGADSAGGEEGGSGSDKQQQNQQPQDPLVPGFGAAQHLPSVPGFGVRVAGYSIGGSAAPAGQASDGLSSTSSAASAGSSTKDKVRKFAEDMIEKYDRDTDGSLDRDEWEQSKAISEKVDRNDDGVITKEEIEVWSMKDAEQSGGWSPSRAFASQKPYRFVSPTEKLPGGLPGWFIQRDADHDGQVAMHEFSRSWSDSTAREFAKSDLNNDGVITPAECLAALKRQPEATAISKLESPRAAPSAESPRVGRRSEPRREEQPAPASEQSDGGGLWWRQE